MLSAWLLPVSVSPPPVPEIEMVSVPLVQVTKVQPAAEKLDALLTTIAWVPVLPVIVAELAISPLPNCAALKVTVAVPDVAAKVRPS